MSVKITTKVWEWSKSEGNTRLILLALADWTDDDGFCFPGIARLSRKARVSERTAQRCVRELQDMGELKVLLGAGVAGNGGCTNKYQIVIPNPIKGGGDKLTGGDTARGGVVTNQVKGGDTRVTRTVREPSVEPSGLVLEPEPPAKKKHKAGHVNGSHPCQLTIETFCVSLGLPKVDGEFMMMKWDADGWPKNWMDKIRYWKRRGWMPSQEQPRFRNGSDRRIAPDPNAGPKGWEQWLESIPEYHSKMKGRPFLQLPEFMQLECNRALKASRAAITR